MSDVARAKDFAIRARGQMRGGNNRVAISLLAQAFHALEHADVGPTGGGQDRFYRWAIEHFHTDAKRDCARFVLSVWNRGDLDELDAENDNKLGRFDALDAVARWDRIHRVAFATWTADPWWP